MSQNYSNVTIVMFTEEGCFNCKIVGPLLRILIGFSKVNASLIIIDVNEEAALGAKHKIQELPVVMYNNRIALSAKIIAALIPSDRTLDYIQADYNFKFHNLQEFGLNELFSSILDNYYNMLSDAEGHQIERYQKINLLEISKKTQTKENFQELTRLALGDYVHIGVLQSIVTSILAISPQSSKNLYQVGVLLGKYSSVQTRFLMNFPAIIDQFEVDTKFRDVLEGLQDLYSANSLGLPIYLVSKSLVRIISKSKALFTVFDSAYCAQMTSIEQPVCFLIAGEIAGLLETLLGESNVFVKEIRCFGLGDHLCQFEIEIGKKIDFEQFQERIFLTKHQKALLKKSMEKLSENTYLSSLHQKILRPGINDYVHISILQQTLNGIKMSNPYFGTLLFYAGLYYGEFGADFAILERVLKTKNFDQPPLEFRSGLEAFIASLNDPSTILTRWIGKAELYFEDNETAIIKLFESAISSGLDFSSDFFKDYNKEFLKLEDFTSGFIQGRLNRILDQGEKVLVEEITDYSKKISYVTFKVVYAL